MFPAPRGLRSAKREARRSRSSVSAKESLDRHPEGERERKTPVLPQYFPKTGNVTVNLASSNQVDLLFKQEEKAVSGTGRIPLWVVATIVGLGLITLLGTFFYGSYTHMGSSL